MNYIESLHTLKNQHLLQWMLLKEMLKNKEEANKDVIAQRIKVKDLYDQIQEIRAKINYPKLSSNKCAFPFNKKCQKNFKNNYIHWLQNGNICFVCASNYNIYPTTNPLNK